MVVWMIFSSKLLTSFLYQQSPVLSSTYPTDRQRQAVVTVKICNPGSDCLGETHFRPFATLVWVATHTLGTTGFRSFCKPMVSNGWMKNIQNSGKFL